MSNKVLLNNIDHQDLKVVVRHSAAYGDAINQALVFPTEYEALQREYPILFRQDEDGAFHSVVLLGLDRDENLFLDEELGWQAHYVPAIQARGPFSIVMQAQGTGEAEPMIHVDLDDPRITDDGAIGVPLFLPHGGNAPYLEHLAGVLRSIYTGLEVSKAMFAAFAEADLIEPVQLEIGVSDTERYDLSGYHMIGADRLARLDGAALERLHRAGFLYLAVWAMSSLGNVQRLIERKTRRRA